MRFQRHADAQPDIAIIGIDVRKGIADAPVVVSPRLPLPDRPHNPRHRRERLDDLAAGIPPARQIDDANEERLAALAIEEAGNAENAGNIFGAWIRAVTVNHALHDAVEIGATAFISRPSIFREPIAMKTPRRAFDNHLRVERKRSAITAIVLLKDGAHPRDILFAPTAAVGLIDGNEY